MEALIKVRGKSYNLFPHTPHCDPLLRFGHLDIADRTNQIVDYVVKTCLIAEENYRYSLICIDRVNKVNMQGYKLFIFSMD